MSSRKEQQKIKKILKCLKKKKKEDAGKREEEEESKEQAPEQGHLQHIRANVDDSVNPEIGQSQTKSSHRTSQNRHIAGGEKS